MRGSRGSFAFVVFIAACSSPASAPPPSSARAAPAEASCKPEAPVAIAIEARPLGADRVAIAIRATPTREVATLEVELVMPDGAVVERGRFGRTAIAQARALEAIVRVDPGARVAAIARVPVDGVTMSRAVEIPIGAPP